VKYRELLGPVQGDKTVAYEFLPGASGMAHLDARAGLYEMYRILGVKYLYKSAVGTTTNGEVLMGIDFDSRDLVLSYQGTAALQPKSLGPAWRDHTLVVPPARAMKQKWLLTSNLADDAASRGAYTFQVTSTSNDSTGSVWVEYNLEFASPRIPTRPTAITTLTVNNSGITGEGVISRTDALTSPVVTEEKDGFYVMCSRGYDFGLEPKFQKIKVGDIPADTGNLWSIGTLWKIIGPSAVRWFQAQSSSSASPGGYAIATAFTLTALKQLAGMRQ
jgi:hypothetical protein